MGTVIGLLLGIGICIQAASGELEFWGLGVALVLVLIGFAFPFFMGTLLTGVAMASPVAAIIGLVTGHGDSALAALGIGLLAFVGQFIIGIVRRDSAPIRDY